MNDTVTMDRSGRLVLPKMVRQKLHLTSDATFRFETVANRIELTLVEETRAALKKKGGILVVPKSGKPLNAVDAIEEVRRGRR